MSQSQPVFEIHDPEINVEEIMTRLRQRIDDRRAQAREQGLDYDHLVEDYSQTDGKTRTSADLSYDLHQLRENAESIWVSLDVRNRGLPLINWVAFPLEKLLHRLVVKYVNVLAGRQTAFNQMVVSVASDLAEMQDTSQVRIENLERTVAELREQLAALASLRVKKD
jgi:hypothetical protein